jgi:hypothetical protein
MATLGRIKCRRQNPVPKLCLRPAVLPVLAYVTERRMCQIDSRSEQKNEFLFLHQILQPGYQRPPGARDIRNHNGIGADVPAGRRYLAAYDPSTFM